MSSVSRQRTISDAGPHNLVEQFKRGHKSGAGGGEGLRLWPVYRQHQPGIGAELPGAQRQRANEGCCDVLRCRLEPGREQQDRVDRAHLGA